MVSTQVSRDVIDLAKPFGPVFWGIIFNLIFFGMSICQALSYFRSATKDRALVKFTALAMIIFDTASSILVISVTWTDLVVDFGGMAQFLGTNNQIGAECVMSGIIAFLAQMYFVSQIYHVKTPGTLGNVILGSIMTLSFIGFVFGMACASVMLLNQLTPHYNVHFELVFGGAKGANAICDIIATVAMCYYLTEAKTGIASTSNLLDALARIFMNRGAAVMLLQIFTFIMFFAFENPQYWLAPHLLLTKMYVNTFFAILNSREFLREKHLGTHVASSSFTNSSSNGSTQVEKHSRNLDTSFTSRPIAFAPNPLTATITQEVTVKGDYESEHEMV
ncbi:hypothetical protein DFH07DRAFT_793928 [Mycena maculata]|uniref:DUF6534 domain-containing protein n=1 Tax=Mycena maculata TaxID=230809 RepID=A0AAD7K7W2_9AGAR|nr:hypothetical protein DFH07DRAFT_793928 [Mycena maculata]